MGIADQMREKLEAALQPQALELVDESEAHRGHAGFQEGGESHFRLTIDAQSLKGKGRVAQHREIYAALGPEIMGRIHALAIEIKK